MWLLIDGVITGKFHIYDIYMYIYIQISKDFCVDKSGTIMFAKIRNIRIKIKRISSSL